MKVSGFLKLKSVVSVLFGLCMLLFYDFLMPIYGIILNQSGAMMTQWTGATFIGIGLVCWFASRTDSSELLKGILVSLFICDTTGFIVSFMGQIGGVANILGWSTVATWLFFAMGLGYYRFVSKDI